MDKKTKQDVVSGVLAYSIVLSNAVHAKRNAPEKQRVSGKTLVELWNKKNAYFKKRHGKGDDDSRLLSLIEEHVETVTRYSNGAVSIIFKDAG